MKVKMFVDACNMHLYPNTTSTSKATGDTIRAELSAF